jgi:hypothetical protein
MAEADILIKASRAKKNGAQGGGQTKQSPLGYFKSVFGKNGDGDNEGDEESFVAEPARK